MIQPCIGLVHRDSASVLFLFVCVTLDSDGTGWCRSAAAYEVSKARTVLRGIGVCVSGAQKVTLRTYKVGATKLTPPE